MANQVPAARDPAGTSRPRCQGSDLGCRSTFVVCSAIVLLACSGAAPASSSARALDQPTLTVVVRANALLAHVASVPAGIDCPPACSASFPPSTNVTLTATTHSIGNFIASFDGWRGDCKHKSKTTCVLRLSADEKVAAHFAEFALHSGGRDRFANIDQILASQLRPARIVFNVPTTLRLHSSTEIKLLLSRQQSIRQLRAKLAALGELEGARIRASGVMEARLTGAGFKIEAITPETQLVSERGVTEWGWEIESTKTGTQRLHLTLSALIRFQGDKTARTIRTFDRTLNVRVTWFDRVSGFIGGNWQWLWTAILIPVAGFILRNRKRPST
jgi:hypothetical protein